VDLVLLLLLPETMEVVVEHFWIRLKEELHSRRCLPMKEGKAALMVGGIC